MKKTTTVYTFNPVIYPIKLYISYKPVFEHVEKQFLTHNGNEFVLPYCDFSDAFVMNNIVKNKDDNKYGVLVLIFNRLSINHISHEATHVSKRIWNWLGEDVPGEEANAYLVGWIAECIEKVIKKTADDEYRWEIK